MAASTLLLVACGAPARIEASTVTVTQHVTVQSTATRTDTSSHEPPPAANETVIDDYGGSLNVIDHDGRYLLYVDIMPGKYRNAGGTTCYWARLHSLDVNDVIAGARNDLPQVIEIHEDDTAFLTRNCGTWQMVHVTGEWDF
ncbi:hypothetical protein A5634_18385 [Mycobacterium asiaticum]|uniref:Uncharacterized protein n=2 Tax=Mycobacterium asiaticum TaxID=1790 RepID=A0A1A3P754_MYCAS|nr:hypothetical protein A5634_18385 [Mycobacterium asiaticum]